ncbi:HAMP domain-containing protein [Ketobacter sp. MCCC 1A13808]|uniref:sensor histidine kinase n=1 Tax=Ketobacter sp. MCCC 1A13808 TaxID=2602738 RepID=UPI000F14537C|nr:ATP-binding protein [Ketobacter sp. MCCC 1A13808]MVF11456.1 HAMP domain-containing protein [Ketobacter sp. MCCC 1A13808]RLP54589.1 MAG: HAMP domain-containing protein [Ketobacter sp.]
MMFKRGIRNQLVTVMLLLVLSVLVLLTSGQISSQQAILRGELQKQTDLMLENLYNRALFQSNQLHHQVEEQIASFNLFEMTDSLNKISENSSELKWVILVDKSQNVVVNTAGSTIQQNKYSDTLFQQDYIVEVKSIGKSLSEKPDQLVTEKLRDANGLVFRLPVQVGSGPWGQLMVGYSLDGVKAQVKQSEQENSAIVKSYSLRSLASAASILLLTFLVISRLAQRLADPIVRLTDFAQRLSKGDFSIVNQVNPTGKDEVGVLTAQFSEMAVNLSKAYQDLEEYNLHLEMKVDERTEQLNQQNENLIKALNDLEESQQQLVHSEKMAALGQLVASIAHEVNTPLGAIHASAGNATKYYTGYANSLEMLFQHATDAEKHLFDWLLHNAGPMESMTTREERKVKRKALQLLTESGSDRAEEIADRLIDMGLADKTDQIISMMVGDNSFRIIDSAYNLTGIMRCNQTIYTATARAAKIAFALKSFARKDHFGEKSDSNINEDINTVLVLYNGLLKQGCEVIKNFQTLPLLNCYPDELNQVWTNLIHNALQAMEYKGVLTIDTLSINIENQPHIQVNISDTGQGISKQIQERIWESFFTTKVAGEGSGLGLGICKRIVEKHRGKIFFKSRPGYTTFSVVLPISD